MNLRPFSLLLALSASFAAAPALAQAPLPPPPLPGGVLVEVTTLRLLRDKGILSQAEYDSAVEALAETSGSRAGDDLTFTVSKFAATLYGFIDADAIWDSTQSFNDTAGNALVAPATTYAGHHSRVQGSVRNTRFGVRLKSPETAWFRASALLEMDLEGATSPIGSGQAYYGTEAAYFSSPTVRLRQAHFTFETPIVDILVGQYWHPYGWGSTYQAASVQVTGIVGEIVNRSPQIRLSHTFRSDDVSFELAAAAVRSPQRDSGTPEGVLGFQLAFPRWTGIHTVAATGTRFSPASIAVSADLRHFAVDPFSAMPGTTPSALTGGGVAVDVFVPILAATPRTKGNSLALTGEVSRGSGISDLYTGLTGGVANPPLPNPTKITPAPTFTPDIDPGLAAYDVNGKLGLITWTTFNVGVQYYFPRLAGRLFVSSNYFRSMSPNARDYLGVPAGATAAAVATAQGKVRDHEAVVDGNVFGDPLPGVRFGLGYAHFADTYVNGVTAVNHRVQLSGYYIF